jgi:hypothetical protein
MATVEESLGGASSLAAGLRQGERTIDSNQTITFYLYARLVLPVDGFVFWVAAPMVTQGALAKAAAFNTSAFNTAPFNESGALGVADNTLVARGSLHYATEMEQTEEANYAVNRVVFTSEQPIQALNRVGPNTMFIATIDGIRFAFSSRSSFFRQAGLWHYVGNAIYSTMESQIIDTPEDFNGQHGLRSTLTLRSIRCCYLSRPYRFTHPLRCHRTCGLLMDQFILVRRTLM